MRLCETTLNFKKQARTPAFYLIFLGTFSLLRLPSLHIHGKSSYGFGISVNFWLKWKHFPLEQVCLSLNPWHPKWTCNRALAFCFLVYPACSSWHPGEKLCCARGNLSFMSLQSFASCHRLCVQSHSLSRSPRFQSEHIFKIPNILNFYFFPPRHVWWEW